MTPASPSGLRLNRRHLLAGVGVTLPSLLLPGAVSSLAAAQNATPEGDQFLPDPASMVQFMHPEKVYFYLPGFQDEAFRAAIYGIDVDTYRAIRADFEATVHHEAMHLLEDETFAASVHALPFAPGATVVAIGESDTDDLQSWFEILRHLVTMHRPDDGIQFINAGISGSTTTQAYDQATQAVGEQPDWVFCLLGGNDSWLTGPEPTKTLVSIEETEKNLLEMRRLVTSQTKASWIWLTRTPIDEARMEADPGFQMGGVQIRNANIEQVNEVISRQPEPVVDTFAAFGDPVDSELLGPDGLHPSLAGQVQIARTVVETLAS